VCADTGHARVACGFRTSLDSGGLHARRRRRPSADHHLRRFGGRRRPSRPSWPPRSSWAWRGERRRSLSVCHERRRCAASRAARVSACAHRSRPDGADIRSLRPSCVASSIYRAPRTTDSRLAIVEPALRPPVRVQAHGERGRHRLLSRGNLCFVPICAVSVLRRSGWLPGR
jgi:hypothetical protein